ncbi:MULTISPECIES: biopolymer transporter ExbD [Cyanophyceae]|uniref:ExbD/TolR family protein n=1 Tax=Cyanophyceae TaxID=3028117 RepID=UPI00168325DE|nr:MULTISPECIES: biopolymer transporter ExbD [Cyanophyceae]MBD1915995.1 biopolymer transporter ExbD [Phormidium sp. FACHB-77]MBD2031736.1 biopolymer transporter ExbD [Phormidium sp. FACHB-322]MBD2052637.1 biopolymer transporter ExbD [Leptolyngbya sp. FACHB-60]
MHLPEDLESPVQINIVPMIDVVFAVLAFFILSSLFLSRNEGLPVVLPGAETAETQDQRQVVVSVNAAGELFVGDRMVANDQLLEAIQTLGTLTDGGLVVIRADQSVSHGQVVAVMDQLRTLPGVQLAIATEGNQAQEAEASQQ